MNRFFGQNNLWWASPTNNSINDAGIHLSEYYRFTVFAGANSFAPWRLKPPLSLVGLRVRPALVITVSCRVGIAITDVS